MEDQNYKMTGFQSACAEYSEKTLSLDERYLLHRSSVFIVEASAASPSLGIRAKDKLIIDRSLNPREGDLIVMVMNGEFKVMAYTKNLSYSNNPEDENFIWGIITTWLRELR